MVDLNIQLPESFFHEEVRDGYLVSAKTKELWAVQLDILNEFDRVCKKYKLKYILDFGTLLGAIRHKGYIPWDDDVDVSMLREDYDKLMEIGPSEFKYPYFLQNQCTEKKFDGATTKLRRSDTTCLLTQNIKYHASYNQGIYIDIFVYDRMPYDKRIQESLHRESKRTFDYLEFASRKIRYGDDSIIKSLARYVYHRLRYGSRKKIIAWRRV